MPRYKNMKPPVKNVLLRKEARDMEMCSICGCKIRKGEEYIQFKGTKYCEEHGEEMFLRKGE